MREPTPPPEQVPRPPETIPSLEASNASPESKLEMILGEPAHLWVVGPYRLSSENIRDLVKGAWLHRDVILAVLSIYLKSPTNTGKKLDLESPAPRVSQIPRVHVADYQVTEPLWKAVKNKTDGTIKPSTRPSDKGRRNLWFPDVRSVSSGHSNMTSRSDTLIYVLGGHIHPRHRCVAAFH